MNRPLIFIFSIILLLMLGCSKPQENKNHPFLKKAEIYYKENNLDKSIEFYKKYLAKFPNSPKGNYELAGIYQEDEDYINAIFYFKKYLSLRPDSQDKDIIKKWIESSKAGLVEKLAPQPIDKGDQVDSEIIADKKTIDYLKRKNAALVAVLKKKREQSIDSNLSQAGSKQDDIKPKELPKTYTVKSGDSLYKISKKIYGSGKYYKNIWDANKKQYPNAASLSPGDILKIPKIDS